MNDPNGLVFVDGTYHLFFQANPEGILWGNMSWGHATSEDLLNWTEHGIVLRYSEQEAIFSGSVVVDHDNSSGLGDGDQAPLVALYTSHYEQASPRYGTQAQSAAFSTDGGMTWRPYSANPVLCRESTDFRDPKVFRHDTAGWLMVAVEAIDHRVVIYRSDNLLHWEYLSSFGPMGVVNGAWECPDLFELPVGDGPQTRWVMVVSIGSGGPAGGSGTQYFVGEFDGRTFTPDDNDTGRWLDAGPDHYAAVSFDNTADRRIMIGWASNWEYAEQTPTPTWRSSMSLAREVRLELDASGRPRLQQHPVLPGPEVLQERFVAPAGGRRTARFTTVDRADPFVVTVDTTAGEVRLDRSHCGNASFHPGFTRVITAPLPEHDGDIDALVVVDGCIVEVYVLDGALTLTAQVFPSAPLTRSEVY